MKFPGSANYRYNDVTNLPRHLTGKSRRAAAAVAAAGDAAEWTDDDVSERAAATRWTGCAVLWRSPARHAVPAPRPASPSTVEFGVPYLPQAPPTRSLTKYAALRTRWFVYQRREQSIPPTPAPRPVLRPGHEQDSKIRNYGTKYSAKWFIYYIYIIIRSEIQTTPILRP